MHYIIIDNNGIDKDNNISDNYIVSYSFSNSVEVEFYRENEIIISEDNIDILLLHGEISYRGIHCRYIREYNAGYIVAKHIEGILDPQITEYVGIVFSKHPITKRKFTKLVDKMITYGIESFPGIAEFDVIGE